MTDAELEYRQETEGQEMVERYYEERLTSQERERAMADCDLYEDQREEAMGRFRERGECYACWRGEEGHDPTHRALRRCPSCGTNQYDGHECKGGAR